MNDQKKNAQKLYRYIQQLAHRLDLQLQNASDWKEFFEVETILTRQKLKDTCEQLLFTGYSDLSRRVEDLLWRKGFYDLIQKLRQDKKLLQTDASLCALYNAHLNAAHCFYHQLLIRIKESFHSVINIPIDWLSELGNSLSSGKAAKQETCSKENTEWAIKSCQRCLLYLGDLARYRIDIDNDEAMKLAERFYHEAILVNPDNGMPHNQLGTLKQQAGYSECEVAYHYLRCLHAVSSFDGADENLKRTFDRNRVSQKGGTESQDTASEKIVECFLWEFLELQERFLNDRYQPIEYSAACQSVIEKFAAILNSSSWDNMSENDDMMDVSKKHRIMSKWSMKYDVRLSGCLMVKIFTICILVVSKLRQKESDVLSAAIAFTFTIFSKLLDYIAATLHGSLLNKLLADVKAATEAGESKQRHNIEGSMSLYNGDANEVRKERARQITRQRRRRRRKERWSEDSSANEDSDESTNNQSNDADESGSDLSEGELPSESSEDGDSSSSTASNSEDDNTDPRVYKDEKRRRKQKTLNEAGRLLSIQLQEPASKSGLHRNDANSEVLHSVHQSDLSSHSTLEAVFSCISEYCYLPTLKVMSDWIRYSNDFIEIYTKDLSCIWQKYAKVINELPLHLILAAVLRFSKRKIDSSLIEETKDPSLKQCKALPEDASLIGLPMFFSLHKNLDFFWAEKTRDPSVLQFLVRVRSLNDFGLFLSQKISASSIALSMPAGTDSHKSSTQMKHPEEEHELQNRTQQTRPQVKDREQAVYMEDKSQTQLMKALARQKLIHEVSELQDKMTLSDTGESPDMPPYLIMDSQALCRHLSLIRSLVKSKEFIVVIPIQVVQALDELKRYNPSAREAIKFLEEEFRQRSRWLRSQKDQESLDFDKSHEGKKKSKLSIEEWRFFQVVKCSHYFASTQSRKNMVSILTSQTSNETSASLGTRATPAAYAACKNIGIQIEALVDFYQKWVASKS